ncbi:phosphate/phosphite/phosphonate ABC transporter substrate-binding protein [Dechloromonas sp. ZY10]|uniref:phosphate/phosphite/phosphonate ABC transporter substrate-binding protein n=1 Tax=Dechloromonas aquae TaxID=2664436 RepID=UPI0035291F56
MHLRAALFLFWICALVHADEAILSFGILNQQSPQLTAERWNPIFRYLSEQTGLRFQLRMGANVQATNAMMQAGEFDLLFSNHNFRPEYDGTYRVIARWGNAPIFGVIAVRDDSPLRQLSELEGRRVAYPSVHALVAYAVPKQALRKAGIHEVEVMAANQEGGLAQLDSRQVDAVAVNSRYLSQYAARKGLRYRELYTSGPYPDLAVSVHPRVPRDKVVAIQQALLKMRQDPTAAALLEANQFPGFFPAGEADYLSVRKAYKLVRD